MNKAGSSFPQFHASRMTMLGLAHANSSFRTKPNSNRGLSHRKIVIEASHTGKRPVLMSDTAS